MSIGASIPAATYNTRISPAGLMVDYESYVSPIWKHEAREMMRGFAGALFVALPLLYTQEMWERAREISAPVLIAILVIAFVVNMGYHAYTGFKVARARKHIVWDTIVSFGLGGIASLITLYLTARLLPGDPMVQVMQLLGLMSVPTSFGASLAINQLGKRTFDDRSKESLAHAHLSEDMQKVTATVLGSFLFAFNIVPTIEPRLMLVDVSAYHTLGILVFSVAISYAIEHQSRFSDGGSKQAQGLLARPWLTTLGTYLVSLASSGVLLWMFGYVGLHTPPEIWVPYIIVVGYSATLGGTAGRLIL